MRYFKKTKYCYSPEKLTHWRIHSSNQSSKSPEAELKEDKKRYTFFLALLRKKD